MIPFITTRRPKWVLCLLALILMFTPLLHAPASYAAEGASPSEMTATSFGIDPATVTSSTYGSQDPLAPQNLRIESVSHNMAIFQWDFKSDEDENNIQVWNADTDGWVTWGNYWTRAVTGLTPETTYRIYITWDGDAKKEHKSNVLEFTTTKDEAEYKDAPLTPRAIFKFMR